MKLSDQQQRDLIGLVSGLSDAESRARAKRLLDHSLEAAAYTRQLRAVTALLRRPEREDDADHLSADEVARLAENIRKRTAQTTAKALSSPRSSWSRYRFPAIAAAILLFVGAIIYDYPTQQHFVAHRVMGEAVFIEPRASLGASVPYVSRSFQDLEKLESGGTLTLIRMVNGSVIVLNYGSSLTCGERGPTITLNEGMMFMDAIVGTAIKTSDLKLTMEPGRVIVRSIAENVDCTVLSGSATLKADGHTIALHEGHRALWDRVDRTIHELPSDGKLPPWVETALKHLDVIAHDRH